MNKLKKIYLTLARKHPEHYSEGVIEDLEKNLNPQELSTMSIVEERLSICNSCIKKKLNICLECFCVIPLKVRINGTACPLNKWSAV